MTSYLIDLVLIAALAFTSWRSGVMCRELRRLRGAESSFGQILKDADASIDRAAHAVVMLKSEGVRTLAALAQRIEEARDLTARLDDAAQTAALADADIFAPAPGAPWLRRMESRLAPASPRNP